MLKLARIFVLFLVQIAAVAAWGQSWSTRYEEGLDLVQKEKWELARDSFRHATTYRPEDASKETLLPGPNGTRVSWRDGLPYSPNFLAAYCLYRLGLGQTEDAQKQSLGIAAAELEVLLDRGQSSVAAYFFLERIYDRLKDEDGLALLGVRAQREPEKSPWKVDVSPLTAEEIRALASFDFRHHDAEPTISIVDLPGRVPVVPTKFALVIGNDTAVETSRTPFAAESARAVRDALIVNAGYAEENVELLVNASAEKILAVAKVLGSRVPADGTVLFYYAGVGINIDGADYLCASESSQLSSSAGTVGKLDLFRPFITHGGRIFAFFETDRPSRDGKHFGSQIPSVGGVAQIQATAPGEKINGTTRSGKSIGAFALAFSESLAELKSNQIPIQDFGWQLFYKLGKMPNLATKQSPSLPILSRMAADSKF